jgi:hypothetical protein
MKPVKGSNWQPCYWVDGVRKTIHELDNAWLTDIAVVDGQVHAIGRKVAGKSYTPVYWSGYRYRAIPNANSVNAIYALDGTIYIAGTYKQGPITMACYWIVTENGEKMERINLPSGKTAKDIIVVKR